MKFLFDKHPNVIFLHASKNSQSPINPPGRPVISGNDSLPESISKFIDYFIKPYLSGLPAYIQDTTDALLKIEELKKYR